MFWNRQSYSNDGQNLARYRGLNHWGPVMNICVSKLTIIGSDISLSPGRRHAIIWTNARILLIRTQGINFSELLSETFTFLFKKLHLKISSAQWRLFCLGASVLREQYFQHGHARILPSSKWCNHVTQLLCAFVGTTLVIDHNYG